MLLNVSRLISFGKRLVRLYFSRTFAHVKLLGDIELTVGPLAIISSLSPMTSDMTKETTCKFF